jgi:iron-sulfur cluster assembly protein
MPAAGIQLSDSAVQKILALCPDAGEGDKGLRVKVVGGGCSGLSYKMDLDQKRDGDRVFERDGARVIVDRKSFLYLNGTELDYSDDLMHAGFNLRNPNVKRSCGCGASFGV